MVPDWVVFCGIICQVFISLFPEYVEIVFSYSVSYPINSHVGGLRLFCFTVPLTILFAAVLSVATNVGGGWWPISDRAVLLAVAFWLLSNNPPNYNSLADAITLLIMLHFTFTGKFWGGVDCIGVLDFSPR